ncbi:acyltransferase family protein [Bariatricus sp. SGI.019]|uniref:acyltransferase family protein n=1 Tax=Bariatricus sp. SGI.019 TaxID=3420548 RepID=UPI003D0335F4
MLSTIKRNPGIDFLRILAMFYVVVLHTLGQGGILDSVVVGSHQYMVSWFLEIWSYCAVDVFALISGYVGYHEEEKPLKISNYLLLWSQVVFYGVIITLGFNMLHPELVTKFDLIEMLFPVTNGLYWYLTAYMGLFLFAPILNTGLSKYSKSFTIKFLVILFFVFSIYDTFVGKFTLNGGYCFAWLIILYLIGAILKKCEIGKKVSTLGAFGGIVFLIFVTWIWKIYGIELNFMSIHINQDSFISYTSPTIVGVAILYIICFSKMTFKYLKVVISFAAPGAFAVYILNTQRFIWRYGMNQRFVSWANNHSYMIPVKVIAFSGIFLIISILIDRLRSKIFHVLHIDLLMKTIEEKMKKIVNKMSQKII